MASTPKNKSMDPPPQKRDRAGSTRRFLEAGLAVFSEVGFDAATTKAIARRAGLNESLIQRYFGSKAGLLKAIIEQFADTKYSSSYPPGRTVEEDIYSYLLTQYHSDTISPNFVRVAFHSVLNNPGFMQTLENKYRSPESLTTRLKSFQADGRIKPDIDVKQLTVLISNQSFVCGIMERSILGIGTDETHKRKLRLFARLITQGIVPKGS